MNTVAEILRTASGSLKKERPGMSLRAVAGRLNVSPSYWSKVLRGERPLSQQLLPRVVKVLSLDTQQTAQLQRSILQEIDEQQLAPATGLKIAAQMSQSPVLGYKHLGESDYWLLEEWYYVPVLNACTLTDRPSVVEIARRLRVDSTKIHACIKKMIAAGFLNENLERTDMQVRFPTTRSHQKVRGFHGAMIEKARHEIQRENAADSFDARLISSVCFAGSPEKLREARLILEEAMYRVANLLSQEQNCEEVYQLNVQLFPLTK